VDDYLRRNGRSRISDVIAYAFPHVDAAKAVRSRPPRIRPVAISQQVLVGQRKVVRVCIDNAVRDGTLIRHPDDTIEARASSGNGADK
jgi:hypothetical protein